MFPAWAGNICLIFWSDATYQLFQIKFGPFLVLLGGEVQYCSIMMMITKTTAKVGLVASSTAALTDKNNTTRQLGQKQQKQPTMSSSS